MNLQQLNQANQLSARLGGGTNATTLAAAAGASAWAANRTNRVGKWHARLSAFDPPAAAPEFAAAAAPGRRLAAGSTSLDAQVLDTPLLLTAAHSTGDRALLSCSDCSANFVNVWDRDDGSGRQRWIASEVPGARGEYTLLGFGGRDACADESGTAGSCWFLSAYPAGPDVNMWHADDGSGRQRWVFTQVGDARYHIRLGGGKADDKVYLGAADDNASVKLYAKPSSRTVWTLGVIPYCDSADAAGAPAATPTPASGSAAQSRVPASAVDALASWLAPAQIDAVLQLVSLPENGTPAWYKNYGYIEFLGDGRGFTATIFGACSGTGDLAMVLDALARVQPRSADADALAAFAPAVRRKKGDDIRGIEGIKPLIVALADDPAWQQAVWSVYIKLYWRFAMDWADKKGAAARRPGPKLRTAAGRGFMLDTAINHGADVGSFEPILDRMRKPRATDEAAWLADFADARKGMLRSGYDNLDTSRTGDRCDLWKALFRDNPDLATPFKAHKGYWGDFTIR
jgi:hypothetical protein